MQTIEEPTAMLQIADITTPDTCIECSGRAFDTKICATCAKHWCARCLGPEALPFCEICTDTVFHCPDCIKKAGDFHACPVHQEQLRKLSAMECACGQQGCSLQCWFCESPVCSWHAILGMHVAALGRRQVSCIKCDQDSTRSGNRQVMSPVSTATTASVCIGGDLRSRCAPTSREQVATVSRHSDDSRLLEIERQVTDEMKRWGVSADVAREIVAANGAVK